MIRDILTIPNGKLRQQSEEVKTFDKNLESLISDLSQTLESQTDPPGLGLSAPQINVFKRVFVAKIKNRIKAFINPKISKFSKKEIAYLEGCFSVPDLYGHVTRPAEIKLGSQDRHGKKSKKSYKGLPARIIQHEVDHLDGILFIDHVHAQNGKIFKVEKDKKGKEELVEAAYV
ncbi:peptide deformylase [Candidatus Curtissbacteria bacterium RIFCSPLOWO2_02_FULL_40_13b]|uniref:Peptide deformylase n=3 Tax=Candidatus Curtissiibacteriota TaxID=1752717 RepID=A0A1F5HXN4_9BACT|nr:MAG: peptide deformylase [Candidatus Curtissbacteria bacterium RIFCSPHIGHO2_01_FULL_40_12]OGE04315.1 MAG: peptide deformylase [Candidatus Curtissbacteria bacterium RIFCSPHIGHO2_12_FULL_41_17]OGE08944.1 MAG: peptide deformylase [Candidatus Curtissbacteria bacterium RIFCSPLOWO2_02_FULL_40_13b]